MARAARFLMAASLDDLIYKVTQIRNEIKGAISSSSVLSLTAKERDFIIKIITEKQLGKGLRGDGRKLPKYRPKTRKIRESMGLQSDYMDLQRSGDFYDSIYIEEGDEGYDIGASVLYEDNKKGSLIERYGEEILQIDKRHLPLLRGVIIPHIRRAIKKYLSR